MENMDPGPSQDRLLSLPAATFAKVCPLPYLRAHLSRSMNDGHETYRPSGRLLKETRPALINLGSLNNACGSAVVRAGDTTVVCGVRGEVLSVDNVPNHRICLAEQTSERTSPSISPSKDSTHLASLNLLVPNIELATGCTPAHLPNNPPSIFAQSLSHRILTLLSNSDIIQFKDLQIPKYDKSGTPDNNTRDTLEISLPSVCAYWTLYIDILFISLDGNAFDTAWTAVVAALSDTRLPMAWFDADMEKVLCSNSRSEAKRLRLRSYPISTTVVMDQFRDASNAAHIQQYWLLADPDESEETLCQQTVTVVVTGLAQVIKVECSGLGIFALSELKQVTLLAEQRWKQMIGVIRAADIH